MGGVVTSKMEKSEQSQYLLDNHPNKGFKTTKEMLSVTRGQLDLPSWQNKYYRDIESKEVILRKFHIAVMSSFHYLKQVLTVDRFMFFYPKDSFFSLVNQVLAYLTIMATTWFFIYYRKEKSLQLSFIGFIVAFIPISGIFYVPFMKFSFTADHWFYAPMIFLLILISFVCKKLETPKNKKFIVMALSIFIFIQFARTYRYASVFANPKYLLAHTIKHNPKSSSPYLILTEQFYKESKFTSGIAVLNQWDHTEFNHDILNLKLFGLLHTGRNKEAFELATLLAKYHLGNNQAQQVNIYMAQKYIAIVLKLDKSAPSLKTLLNLFATKASKLP